jgi:beta-glucanase (GH16 family)
MKRTFFRVALICLVVLIAIATLALVAPRTAKSARQAKAASCFSQLPSQIDCSYRFVFDDEANGTSVDYTKWNSGWLPEGGGGSGQLATFLSANCSESGGFLRLTTHEPTAGNYTSCALNSLFTQAYGFFSFRGYMAPGAGLWSAAWMYSMDNGPEIDVTENLGNDATTDKTTYHTDFRDYATARYAPGPNLTTTEATYSVLWRPGDVWLYCDLDSQAILHISGSSIPSIPMHLLMNLMVGGAYRGPVTEKFPSVYKTMGAGGFGGHAEPAMLSILVDIVHGKQGRAEGRWRGQTV